MKRLKLLALAMLVAVASASQGVSAQSRVGWDDETATGAREPSWVDKASAPAQIASVEFLASSPEEGRAAILAHATAQVVGGVSLSDRLLVGALAQWSRTRARWAHEAPAGNASGVLVGPVAKYTTRRFCILASALVGHVGETWGDESRRLIPTLIGCYALTRSLVLRLGALSSVQPERPFSSATPLVGWAFRSGRFETRALLPRVAWARYNLSNNVYLGARLSGYLVSYALRSRRGVGNQLRGALAAAGLSVGARLLPGLTFEVAPGVSFSPIGSTELGKLGDFHMAPSVQTSLTLDTSALQ